MRFPRLDDWLSWQESLNPKSIDLGLSRCEDVAERMALLLPPAPVVTVAGTNGKGSCIAFMEAILERAGYTVAAYTSPYLARFNESLRIGGAEAADDVLMAAFERVDRARGDVPLTCFEFRTLAALDIIARTMPDAVLLEVGLGGRLDAVNLVDADVAVVTTVDVDHIDWLGSDRELIGREKAGIFRPRRPVVCGEREPPASLVSHAEALGAPLYRNGREYGHELDGERWHWHGPRAHHASLPPPGLAGAFQRDNAAAALMALSLLGACLPVGETARREGLAEARLPARHQVFSGAVERIVDVAHNAQAARALAASLAARPIVGRHLAVFAMLGDKDVEGVATALGGVIDRWHVAGLPGPRGASGRETARRLRAAGPRGSVEIFATVAGAYRAARFAAARGDRIVAFGSFVTAREALRLES